jgi:TRAP-type C4-dicarboxylate transport system substrate-binding protein
MLLRKTLATLLGALFVLAGISVSGTAEAAEVKLATLAPKKSPWGKVFTTWGKAVKKKSKGKMELKWYFGTQGDEQALVAKMRSGQLDGAAVTSVGLSKIYKNWLVLQMPGLFNSWSKLDSVRDAMKDEMAKGTSKEGFTVLGYGDVGLAHTMSKGKGIKSPDDLKSMKVYAWDQDAMASTTGSVLGYTPVLKSVPGLLPSLQSGAVNVITVPALAATQLQWASELDHITAEVAGVGIGGLVITKKSLEALPADQKELLISTGKKAGELLTKRIRKEDAKAYKSISKRMTVVTLSGGEKDAWRKKFKKIRAKLGEGNVFPSSLIKKVEGLAGL